MKRIILLTIILIMCIFSLTSIGFAIPSIGAVQGTVTDASTASTLSGATVIAFSSNSSMTTLTDSSGNYILTGLTAGTTISVSARKPGYTNLYQQIPIVSNSTTTSNFALVPIASPTYGTIQGTVTDSSTGATLSGATVITFSNNSSKSTLTDSTGHYLITGLSTGAITVSARTPGYNESYKQSSIIANSTTVLDFALAPIVPSGTGAVQGTVTDLSTGLTLSGATVNGYGSNSTQGTSITDSTGHYLITGLASGTTASVSARKSGYNVLYQSVSILANSTTTSNFALVPIASPSYGAVQGTVTDISTALTLSGATVIAFSSNSSVITLTDSTGHYLLTGLTAGTTIYVSARKPGYNVLYQQVPIIANSTTVSNFALTPTPPPTYGAVQGTVTDASTGLTLSGATVVAFSFGSTEFTLTDSSGHYLVTGLNANTTVTVSARTPGYNLLYQQVPIITNTTTTSNFALVPYVAPVVGSIQGTVTDITTGNPIIGAIVYAKATTLSGQSTVGNSGTSQYVATDSSGFYFLKNLNVGNYTLSASKSGYNSSTTLTSVSANNTTFVNFSLQTYVLSSGSVNGTVTDATTGDPIVGAFVYVAVNPANWYSGLTTLWTQTDSTGFYQLDNIPSGTGTLKAVKPGYTPVYKQVVIPVSTQTTVNFALVPIPVQQTGTVTGTISDATTGLPIQGALVFVKNVTEISASASANSQYTWTDENGNYSIYSVSTGAVNVVAEDSGYQQSEIQVQVASNQTTVANLALSPYGNATANLTINVTQDNSGTSPFVTVVIPGATIFLPINNEILPLSEWDNNWSISDNGGTAVIPNLPAGNLLLVVSKDGYQSSLVQVTLINGTNNVTVPLATTTTTSISDWQLYR